MKKKAVGILMVALIVGLVLSRIGHASLTDGLVAYYPFNGNANDESGYGNHGTVYGATLAVDRFGNLNKAYHFNGIDNYIKASAENLPTGDRTVSLWFKADDLNNGPVLLGYGGSDCGQSWFMAINHSETPNTYHLESHCNINQLDYQYAQDPRGIWYNWVITTSSSGTHIYINGIRLTSDCQYIDSTYVNGKDLAIGVNVSGSGSAPYTDSNCGYFTGLLDDIRIYNRSLSDSEIKDLFYTENHNPTIMLSLNKSIFSKGESINATANINNPSTNKVNIEAKIFIIFPNGSIKSIFDPYLTFTINGQSNLEFKLLDYTFKGTEPKGIYEIVGRFLNPLNGDSISSDTQKLTYQ